MARARKLEVAPPDAGPRGDAVEQRLRRIEDALTALQSNGTSEDRIVERLAAQLNRPLPYPPPPPANDSRALIVSAGKALLPQVLPPIPHPPPPPAGETPRPLWWPLELLHDLRYCARMFLDYRFQTSPSAKYVLVAVAAIYGAIWLFVSGSLFGGAIERVYLSFSAIIVYKVLAREVARYKLLLQYVSQAGIAPEPPVRYEPQP